MTAAAIPYFEVRSVGGIQTFGMLALLGLGLGSLTTVLLGRKRGIRGGELGLVVPLAGLAVFLGAHWYDVAWYQWDQASTDPGLWLRLMQGVSAMGGFAGAAILVFALGRLGKTELGVWADVAAVGLAVGLAIGRIGCALVHDHPGVPTDSVLGVDFPPEVARWALGPSAELDAPIRLFDLGILELLVTMPLAIAGLLMIRRLRAGTTAAILAIAYASVRFPLDYLRSPTSEPRHLGVTGGQAGAIVMVVLGIVALWWIRREPAQLPSAVVKA